MASEYIVTLIKSIHINVGDNFEKPSDILAKLLAAIPVNIPTLKPIDKDIIVECAKSSDMLFTVEDHSIVGGLGSAVSDVLTEHFPAKLSKIGLNDVFPESAPPADLYEKYGLSANKIAERVISESMG